MRRNWKSKLSICLAALLICLVPVNTTWAEEETQTVSGNDLDTAVQPTEGIQEDSDMSVQPTEAEAYSVAETDGGPVILADGEGVDETESAGGLPTIRIFLGDSSDNIAGDVKLSEEDVEYIYVNNHDQWLTISVSVDEGVELKFFEYDFMFTSPAGEIEYTEQEVEENTKIPLDRDGKYFLLVTAKVDDNTLANVESDIIVDTKKPEIIGIEAGGSYPEGKEFQVREDYLESVWINGDKQDNSGSYKITAKDGGNFCEIKARDKAGNEETCVIRTGKSPEQNDIAGSGFYVLEDGEAYHLVPGSWTVFGDKTVYQGDSVFYVSERNLILFQKND